MELYLRESAVGCEGLGALELGILLKLGNCGFASAFVARSEVDEEGAIVER
jgi:hypothetical protein